VAVRLEDSRREGVLAGTGEDECLLKYIPAELKVQKEETVVTSGLDGVFPSGIPVGAVSLVRERGGGFFQEVYVTPFQQDSTIEEVLVLKRAFAPPLSEGKGRMRGSPGE
jgi:rod shape-determining protein MreC